VIDGVRFDERGLAPAIVQDAVTARVLMLGWVNTEALRRTEETGKVHFWSRSRQTLWMKGETSGNTLTLVDATTDCDGDAVLLRVIPTGPTCHTEKPSCFDAADDNPAPLQGFAWLEDLWALIALRTATRPEGSYTARLVAGGVDTTGRKVAEEATEVLLAAKDHAAGTGPAERVTAETADLVYHLLVLLAERGLTPAATLDELRNRMK